MIKILNSSLQTLAILENIVSPIITEELNRGFTFSFSTVIDGDKSDYVNYQNIIEASNNYFNIAYTEDERTQDSITIHAECEHVSYDLLTANFTAGFTGTGLFSAVATTILSGTGFTVGTVASTASETISVLESTNAKQLLLLLASLHNGEIEWDKYAINQVAQRGSNNGVQFRYRKNIAGVKRITDNRKKVGGLPTISYQISPAELEFEQGYIDAGISSFESYQLGDTIRIIDDDLGIDTSLRIVKESHDVNQRMIGNVEISNFVEDLSDTITTIQTTSVAKDNPMNGCSIGPDDGFVAERSDSLVKTFMNATNGIEIDLRASTTASYTPVFYVTVDTGSGTANLYLAGDAILTGRAIIGSGNSIFKADSNGIYLGNATFGSAPFRVTPAGILTATSATINGQFTSKSTAGTTLMQVYQDTNGGQILINNNAGDLDVKIGVEAASASNTGGTLQLYNNDAAKPRVQMGINATYDAGIFSLIDTNGQDRIGFNASLAGGSPTIFINNSAGSTVTFLQQTVGNINGSDIATHAWAAHSHTVTIGTATYTTSYFS